MQITMVKKRLVSGEPCEKCAQTEEMLRRRGHWDRIDAVVWAVEGEPDSEGHQLGRAHGVDVAPFFIVERDGEPVEVYTSGMKMVKSLFAKPETDDVGKAIVAEDVPRLANELEGAEPVEVLRVALEHYGEHCAIAFSGAEDVILIDMATRLSLPFSVFTLDTGRLHAETYAYLDDVRRRYGISIEYYFPAAEEVCAFVRAKGPNAFYRDGHAECCEIRRVRPLRRALEGRGAWITGRRRDQNPVTRGHLPVIEVDGLRGDGGLIKFNPLAAWSSEQVFAYMDAQGVAPNPLHAQGYYSIGCEPCTRPTAPDQHEREGRWWWEHAERREGGLHDSGEGI